MNAMIWLALASLMVLSACGGDGGDGETARSSAAMTMRRTSAASDLRKELTSLRIENVTPEQAADQLLNFAQSSVYANFFPGNPTTQSYPPFRYRAYSNGVLLGVVVTDGMGYTMNGVYAMGGDFGDSPVYVGLVTDFITLTEPNELLAFTPSRLQVAGYAGETQEIQVTAKATKIISDAVNVAIASSTTTFSRVTVSATFNPGEYLAKLQLSSALPVGQHIGQLELRLCRDSAAVCADPYPGSPVSLPYEVTIHPGTDLRPLRALQGAPAWSGATGNASNNAYVAATLNTAAFTRRFKLLSSAIENVTIEGDRIYFAASGERGSTVRAIDESSGQVQWITEISDSTVHVPVVSSGRVYVTSDYGSHGPLSIFDASDGAQIGQISLPAHRATPALAYRGRVYLGTSRSGESNIARLDPAIATLDWSTDLGSIERTAAFAVDDVNVYAHDGFKLSVLRSADGSVLSTIKDPRTSGIPGFGKEDTLVLDGVGGAYLAHRHRDSYGPGRRLIRFDTTRGVVSWEQTAMFTSNPVLANGVLYVNAGSRLEARSPATGNLLWAWDSPEWGVGEHLLVIGNLAFVSGFRQTHVVDLTTRSSVWSYPASGPLAVSANGVLYIAPPGELIAINLH